MVILVTTYKFKHYGIIVEINKQKIIDSLKNLIIIRKTIFLKKNILNLSNLFYKNLKKILIKIIYTICYFKYIIYFLNMLFLINNIRYHVQIF